jgi:Tfp pilus assembly protein PilO
VENIWNLRFHSGFNWTLVIGHFGYGEMMNRVKIYRILTILVVLLLLYTILVKVLPEFGNFIYQISAYNDSKKELVEDRQWKQKSVSLKLGINRLKEAIEKINVDIPSEKEFSKPLEIWDSLVVKNKIIEEKFQITNVDTSGKYYRFIEVKVNLNGLYLDVAKFIEDIESCPIIIMVRDMNVQLPSLSRRQIEVELALEVLLKKI